MDWDDYDDHNYDSNEENLDGYSIVGEDDLLPENVEDLLNESGDWDITMAMGIDSGVIANSSAIDARYDITGQLDNSREYNKARRESYQANKEIRELERELDRLDVTGNTPDERMGKMTAADLQLGRFSHMSGTVRQVAKDFLTGKDNFGLDKLTVAAAKESFGSILGSDPAAWAKQIRVDSSELPSSVQTIDPLTGQPTGSTDYKFSNKDISTAIGMIKDTAGYYMDKGVGSSLAGQGSADKMIQQEEDLLTAFGYADELAGLYIHKKTVGSEVEASRRKAVRDALMNRALTGVFSEESKSILPLPNEVGVMGLKPTLSSSGFQGTKFDRVSFEIAAAKNNWIYGSDSYFENKPDIRRSLFGGKGKERLDFEHESALNKMHFIRKTLREQFPTNRDESAGQANTSGWDTPYGEQSLSQDALDLASAIGLDKERPDLRVVARSQEAVYGISSHTLQHPRPIILGKEVMVGPLPRYVNDRPSREIVQEVQGPPRLVPNLYKTNDTGMTKATGQEEGGMYGAKGLSDTDRFVQLYVNNPELEAQFKSSYMDYSEDTPSQFIRWQLEQGVSYGDEDFNDTSLMQKFMQSRDDWVSEGIQQRTPEWYAARKGIITASTLIDSKGRLKSDKELGLELGKRKLGLDDEFIGNDYTAMGQKGEKLALQAFLNEQKSKGNPLTHKEVGLITNDEYGGMGASPDGKLFDEDGNSAGLLELKYLTDLSNTAKYDHQMQMQMMITGEEQTHFFALNRYTGESVSRLVKADPKYQKELKARIDSAINISNENDTAVKLKNLEGEIMSEAKTARQRSGKEDSSQTESVDLTAETPSIKPFSIKDVIENNTNSATGKDPAGYFRSLEQADRKSAIKRGFSSVAEMEKFDADSIADKEKAAADKEKAAADKEAARAAKEAARAAKEKADADKKAAKASQDFTKSIKEAVKNLAGFAVGANESSMDTARAAAKAGMTAEQGRGIEFALKEGGLTLNAARSVMSAAGDLQANFNDVTQVKSTYTRIAKAYLGAGLNNTIGALPTIKEFQAMSSPELIAWTQEGINKSSSAEAASQFGRAAGMLDLVPSTATSAEILEAGILDKEGAYAFNRANQEVGNTVQTVSESITNVTGTVGGYVTGGALLGTDLATVGGTIAGMYASKKVLDAVKATQSSSAIKGGISNVAKSALSNVSAGAHKLAKAGTPLAAVTGVGRLALGVEDDNSLSDSLLDIAEFTAAGAAFGPKGALFGAVAGVGYEIGEAAGWWGGNEDLVPKLVDNADLIPSPEFVDKPTVSRGDTKVSNINDIDVNVSVTPDGVKTNVTANGEDYSDTEVH